MKYFVYTIIGIVTIAVIAGFFIVGSPKEERLRRFDEVRVQDLQFLQSEIINYWMNKNLIPENLLLLRDDIRGVNIPRDPETGNEYRYAVKGPLSFSLCAVFARPTIESDVTKTKFSRPSAPYPAESYYGQENWMHGSGEVCFERTIDPQIYKPKEPVR